VQVVPSQVYCDIYGGKKLCGAVSVSGAKNSILKLLPASMLSSGDVILANVPMELYDVRTTMDIFARLGIKISELQNERLRISSPDDWDLTVMQEATSIRVTYLLVPAQLQKYGHAYMPRPGGCAFSERNYDFHLSIWSQMGANVMDDETKPYVVIRAPNGGLAGTEIALPYRSMGGTETALLSGAIAKGVTCIYNAYVTPELSDLIGFLEMMGVRTDIRGNSQIVVHGCNHFTGCTYKVMPDRIEAVTWVVAGALSQGRIKIHNFATKYLTVPMVYFEAMGIPLAMTGDTCIVEGEECFLEGQEIVGGSYPGIISDMLPMFSVLALRAKGLSRIIDVRYPDRFQYFKGLEQMGAEVCLDRKGEASFYGPQSLYGAEVAAPDLRGGMSLLLAGLVARGKTRVRNIVQVLRGYNLLAEKIVSLGAEFKIGGHQ